MEYIQKPTTSHQLTLYSIFIQHVCNSGVDRLSTRTILHYYHKNF
jgi:hypothetical protein